MEKLIVQISDLHVGMPNVGFNESILTKAISNVNEMNPDLVLVTGDITNEGYYTQYVKASYFLELIESDVCIIPGNHDSRNIGNEVFEDLIGHRQWVYNDLDGFTIIGLDSSEPDLDYGKIGRYQYEFMYRHIDIAHKKGDFIIIALHHHTIPIPKTGRERNVLTDAGDFLKRLIDDNIDLVVSGHKHVANVWKMNNTIFANAGSVSSVKLRGRDLNSFNSYSINDDSIEINLHQIIGDIIPLAKFDRI